MNLLTLTIFKNNKMYFLFDYVNTVIQICKRLPLFTDLSKFPRERHKYNWQLCINTLYKLNSTYENVKFLLKTLYYTFVYFYFEIFLQGLIQDTSHDVCVRKCCDTRSRNRVVNCRIFDPEEEYQNVSSVHKILRYIYIGTIVVTPKGSVHVKGSYKI